jgi:hypothetical protein
VNEYNRKKKKTKTKQKKNKNKTKKRYQEIKEKIIDYLFVLLGTGKGEGLN